VHSAEFLTHCQSLLEADYSDLDMVSNPDATPPNGEGPPLERKQAFGEPDDAMDSNRDPSEEDSSLTHIGLERCVSYTRFDQKLLILHIYTLWRSL